MTFFDKLVQKSNTRNIITGVLFILLVNLVLFPLFTPEKLELKLILDLHFGFSLQYVKQVLSIIEAAGRKKYLLSTLFIDTPYALIYGFVYALIIARLSQKISTKIRSIVMLTPFLISLFDLIENAGITYFIISYPNIQRNIVYFVSLANQLKWVFALLTAGVVLFLLINNLVALFRQK